MKTLLASLVLLPALATANTITITCTPAPLALLGQSNSNTQNCSGFSGIDAPPPGAVINSIQMDYTFDFQYNTFNAGSKNVTFSFNLPGTGLDVSGAADPAHRPVTGSVSITSGFAPFLAAFTIADSYTGASSAVTGGTFNEQFVLDYTVDTPEPGTLAIVGIALVGAGLLRRRV